MILAALWAPACGESSKPSAAAGQPATAAGDSAAQPGAGVSGGAGSEADAGGGAAGTGTGGSVGEPGSADDAGAAGASGAPDRREPAAGSGGAGSGEDAGSTDAATSGTEPGLKPPPPAVARRCTLPAGCTGLATDAFSFAACCSRSIECGFQLVEPAELRELFFLASQSIDPLDLGSRCVPHEKIFSAATGLEEQRILVDDGDDVLLTPDCDSRNLLAFPLFGCCTSSGTCGYSTDQTAPILGQYVKDAPFVKTACFTGEELNAQFRMTDLAALAHLPEMRTSCDYAAISARQPD
jgi:hypothetical protein